MLQLKDISFVFPSVLSNRIIPVEARCPEPGFEYEARGWSTDGGLDINM